MYPEERRQAMGQLVQSRGRVSVQELAETFDVTTETVRRDLSLLEKSRVVRKVHGGAVRAASLSVMESRLDERDRVRAAEKEMIARAAFMLLPEEGGTVLVDAGSTTGRLIEMFPHDRRLTVFTHGVSIAARLASLPHIDLHLLPGKVRRTTQAAVGAATIEAIQRLQVDVCFLGTDAVSPARGFSTPDPDEALVKTAIVQSARHRVVLADSGKFGGDATVAFAELGEVDTLVTEAESDVLPRSLLSQLGVELLVAAAAS